MNKASPTYKSYLLGILLLILAASFMDRMALGLLLQDIKVDLALSDSQLGFMSGIAFALFYSSLGIPIARWADRGNRVSIISLAAAVASVMVAMCGVTRNFTQLLLVRVGVAVGEAGCVPAANSLIADYFSRAERPRAAGIYWLGATVGGISGYLLAGWLSRLYGWRATFMLLGVPGALLAVLARFTLNEPRRTGIPLPIGKTSGGTPPGSEPNLKDVFITLWSLRTFRHFLFCLSVMYFFSYGTTQWQPSFFIRTHGLTTEELGTWFALVCVFAGIGTYLGGWWASHCAPNNEPVQLAAAAIAFCALSVISPFIYLFPNRYLSLGTLIIAAVVGNSPSGPLVGAIQTLVPERMRAVAIATIFLFANLIGMGLGPLAVGLLSDRLRPWFGNDSLRYALLFLTPGYLWCAVHFWYARKTVEHDLKGVTLGE